MNKVLLGALVVSFLILTGCAKVVGPYYLEQGKYEEGIKFLSEQLKESPDDASTSYYIGRYYLGLDKPKEALEFLDTATRLAPENGDYMFWKGVAHWALLEFEQERSAYRKAIALDPKHISANLYLGHGYLDQRDWAKALTQYEVVITLDKYNPEALYNKAVALRGLGKTKDELAAWKKFLEYYPDGSLAMQATERLNLLGDFTYRNFILGKRNVTLRSMTFKSGTDDLDSDGKESLHVLSAMMETNKKLSLHVVCYVDGDTARAKVRAENVRDYILSGHPGFAHSRLPLSWFGTAEKIEMGGKPFSIDNSVQFITVVQ